MVVFRRASCRGLDSMSALMVRRTGSLHDPEVRPMGCDFSRFARNAYRAYRKDARGIGFDKLAERSVWFRPGGDPSAFDSAHEWRHHDAVGDISAATPDRCIPDAAPRRGPADGGVNSQRSRSPICERLHSPWARVGRKTSHRSADATRPVLADAFKHLVIACKNNGWLAAGSSSAKSGSLLQ